MVTGVSGWATLNARIQRSALRSATCCWKYTADSFRPRMM